MPLSDSSLERLIPDDPSETDVTGGKTLELHTERYRFAARHAVPGRALDIACGVGYGTRLLAEENPGLTSCLGVDVSQDAVHYAEARYARSGVSVARDDALEFRDAESFDTFVSLETIEHVSNPQLLIDNLAQMLRPGGVLVASVPTTPSADINPYHFHDFTSGIPRIRVVELPAVVVRIVPLFRSPQPACEIPGIPVMLCRTVETAGTRSCFLDWEGGGVARCNEKREGGPNEDRRGSCR